MPQRQGGSGRQGLATTYEKKKRELACLDGPRGYSQILRAVDACWMSKVMGESPKASPPDDGSAKLKPPVQREGARRIKVWERQQESEREK